MILVLQFLSPHITGNSRPGPTALAHRTAAKTMYGFSLLPSGVNHLNAKRLGSPKSVSLSGIDITHSGVGYGLGNGSCSNVSPAT